MYDDMYEDEKPELNITPLVDIMLVLLAILMVSMPAVVYQEKINLPSGSKIDIVKNTKRLNVQIDANKNVFLNGKKIGFKELADDIILIAPKYSKSDPVYISADKNLLYSDIMYVLKTFKLAGFNKISLKTK